MGPTHHLLPRPPCRGSGGLLRLVLLLRWICPARRLSLSRSGFLLLLGSSPSQSWSRSRSVSGPSAPSRAPRASSTRLSPAGTSSSSTSSTTFAPATGFPSLAPPLLSPP